MFVPEHKHPMMSTRNRLHEFLVDDAFALKCSGMFRKSEKTVRYTSFACLEGVDAYPNSVGAQPVTNNGGALAAPLLALTKLMRKRHNILCNCCFSVRLNSDSFGERS